MHKCYLYHVTLTMHDFSLYKQRHYWIIRIPYSLLPIEFSIKWPLARATIDVTSGIWPLSIWEISSMTSPYRKEILRCNTITSSLGLIESLHSLQVIRSLAYSLTHSLTDSLIHTTQCMFWISEIEKDMIRVGEELSEWVSEWVSSSEWVIGVSDS